MGSFGVESVIGLAFSPQYNGFFGHAPY